MPFILVVYYKVFNPPHGWCSCSAQLVFTKNTTWNKL